MVKEVDCGQRDAGGGAGKGGAGRGMGRGDVVHGSEYAGVEEGVMM